jgi:hypothetical protein
VRYFASNQATMPVAPGLIERRVRIRMIRQDVLTTRDPPLELSVVLDESVLLRRIGDEQRRVAARALPGVRLPRRRRDRQAG